MLRIYRASPEDGDEWGAEEFLHPLGSEPAGDDPARRLLHDVFGHHQFRGAQEEIIRRVSAGEDAIALVGVDQDPNETQLAKIRALPHVKEARILRF